MIARIPHIAHMVIVLVVMGTQLTQSQNIRVTSSDTDQCETAIAVSPLNSNHLLAVWNALVPLGTDMRNQSGYGFSTDGGNSWHDSLLGSISGGGCDPSAQFDRYDNAFYCHLLFDGKSKVQVHRTNNLGSSWFYALVDTAGGADHPFMTVDNTGNNFDGRIYVAWTQFTIDSSVIWFSYSSDHGQTFTQRMELASHLGGSGDGDGDGGGGGGTQDTNLRMPTTDYPYVQDPMPAIAPNGDVYVIWDVEDITSGSVVQRIRKSINGGVSFQPDTLVGGNLTWIYSHAGLTRFRNDHSISISPDNHIYVAYLDKDSGSNSNLKILLIQSPDSGNSWSSPVKVWDQPNTFQYFPSVSANFANKIYVTFMASSSYPVSDAYIGISPNGGTSFIAPLKVTTQGSNPNNRHILWASGNDYMASSFSTSNNSLYMTWADFRDTVPNKHSAIYFSLWTALVAPGQICPHNLDSVGTSPTLSWNASTGANSYGLQVASDTLFIAPTVNVTGITSFSYTISGLTGNSIYYWRVNASDTDGTSNWSSTSWFTTASPRATYLTGSSTGPPQSTQQAMNSENLGNRHPMAKAPPPHPILTWTRSGPCGITYYLYKYICFAWPGCTDTIGNYIHSGTDTSYIDSSWIIGKDSTETAHYYVKATAGGQSSYSNKVSYSDGGFDLKSERVGQIDIPKKYSLLQAYPNPFNPTTTIQYALPEDVNVVLKVFNVLGMDVKTLIDEHETAGYKSISFDGSNFPSGVYFYRFQAGKFVDVKKMLLIK